MDKITFENATLVNPAKVTIDGVDYEVTPEETTGGTPASANTFNAMQENIEKSVVAVGTTQPSTNEKVWIKTGKNHFKSENVIRLTNCTYSNGVVTQIEADTATNVRFVLQSFLNANFIANLEVKDVQVGKTTFTFVKDSSFNQIQFGASGTSIDTKILVDVKELEDGQTYTLSFDLTNITQGSISWRDIQIEQGSEATEHEGHVDKEILVKNDNGVFEEFYSEQQKNKSSVLLYTGGISNTTDTLTYSGDISNYDKLIIQLGSTLEGDSKIIEIDSQGNVINASAYVNAFVNNFYNCSASILASNNEVQMKGRQLTGWSTVPISIFGVTR